MYIYNNILSTEEKNIFTYLYWILGVALVLKTNSCKPCIVHPLPQAKAPSVPIFPTFVHLQLTPQSSVPSVTTVLSLSMCWFFLLIPSPSFVHSLNLLLSDSCKYIPCIYASVCSLSEKNIILRLFNCKDYQAFSLLPCSIFLYTVESIVYIQSIHRYFCLSTR